MSERTREALLYCSILAILAAIVALRLPHSAYLAMGDWWPGEFVPGNVVLASNGLWSHSVSGFGSPQFQQSDTFWAAFNSVVSWFGIRGPNAQFAFLFVLVVSAGLSTAYFARALLPERRLIALLAGIGAVSSMQTVLWLTNPLFDFALCYYPLVAGLIINRMREPQPWPRFAGELSLLGTGLVLQEANEPLTVFAVLWAIFWVIVCGIAFRTWRKTLPALGVAAAVIFVENIWWAYAAYIALFGGGDALRQVFAGPLAWRWVDARASILNQLTQQNEWDIVVRQFRPDLGPFLSGWMRATLYVPATAAVFAVLSRPGVKRVALLWFIAAVCVLIGKGSHEPFGAFNTWLYLHAPGFWLLRDPAAITNVMLHIVLYVLAAAGIVALVDVVMHSARGRLASAPARAALVSACAIALCANGWSPLHRDFLPSTWLDGRARTSVLLPDYWPEAARYLNEHAQGSRVLLLPNDDFYQMFYEWGYYGADTVAWSLLTVPALAITPGPSGYVAGSSGSFEAISELDREIRSSAKPIAPGLAALGVGWILQRNDIVTETPGRDIYKPARVAAFLRRQPGISKIVSFGKLDIYRVDSSVGLVSAFEGSEIPVRATESDAGQAVQVDVPPGARLLIFRETYDSQWQPEIGGVVQPWRHVAVDRIFNGWVLPRNPPANVTLRYAPTRAFNALKTVSAAGVVVALGLIAAGTVRRRRGAAPIA